MRLFKIILIIILPVYVSGQQSKISKGVNYLSEYISSEKFNQILSQYGDLPALDSLYTEALKFYDNDYSEALLTLTFATIPYKVVPIRLPIMGIILNYPLVSHNDSVFNIKNENIPKLLMFDSPATEYGDKDKPAHFFGNAFIAYNSLFFDFGNVIGYFVEVFEEKFKVQSKVDERDIYVNYLGNLFGKALKKDKSIMPSRFFLIPTLFQVRYSP